ncbi:hypothetical protein ACKGJO_06540 [Gracilimonas sp. Q87]|uniref:hypothetical protein n=1 Tax=Gracilimonas sp. Q87 TaxID=3384766 RepID=UPI0039845585
MAIPSNPARSRIAQEFGSNTLAYIHSMGGYPSGARSLKSMGEFIFGVGNSYGRDAFAGYGKPSYTANSLSASESATLDGYIDVSFNLSSVPPPNTGNDHTTVIVDVWEYSRGSAVPSSVDDSYYYLYTSGGTKNITQQMPKKNTRYYLRIRYFNKFNENLNDHFSSETVNAYSSVAVPDPDNPYPIYIDQPDLSVTNAKATWTNREDGMTYIQWQRYSNGSWSDWGALQSFTAVSGQTGTHTSSFGNNDTVRYKTWHTVTVTGNTFTSNTRISASITMDYVAPLSPDPTNVTFLDGGQFSQVSWNTPEMGNPTSYSIDIIRGSITNNLVTGLSGSSTSYTFDVCNVVLDGDTVFFRVYAYYSGETGMGESITTTITSCGRDDGFY